MILLIRVVIYKYNKKEREMVIYFLKKLFECDMFYANLLFQESRGRF